MDGNLLVTIAGLVVISVTASLVVLWIIGRLLGPAHSPAPEKEQKATTTNTFLLRYGLVSDHDCAVEKTLHPVEDWVDLRNWLAPRFAGLPELLPDDDTFVETFATHDPASDAAKVTIDAHYGITHVTLDDPVATQPADRQQAICLEVALAEDHAALQHAPVSIWKTGGDGTVIWENDACRETLGPQLSKILEGFEPPVEQGDIANSRVAIPQRHGKSKIWFDVHAIANGRFTTFYATNVTNAVTAEAAQREFVQTLTKTFANLTTGLAIFDIKQQLALFNPALVDLTALPAEFLSARPSLMSFFDNLRDRRVMPEPKSYSNWRAQINEMIKTASDGLYQETWALPSGATYRVTGRPHPDGAVAFLFEDITAEISLTRRFRAQSDLRQAVMDKLDHAVAMIASNNVVISCNAAWTAIFGVDPDTSFAELGLRDLLSICARKYPHPEFWSLVEAQMAHRTTPGAIASLIETETDGAIRCRLEPVAGGAALICIPVETRAPKTRSARATT